MNNTHLVNWEYTSPGVRRLNVSSLQINGRAFNDAIAYIIATSYASEPVVPCNPVIREPIIVPPPTASLIIIPKTLTNLERLNDIVAYGERIQEVRKSLVPLEIEAKAKGLEGFIKMEGIVAEIENTKNPLDKFILILDRLDFVEIQPATGRLNRAYEAFLKARENTQITHVFIKEDTYRAYCLEQKLCRHPMTFKGASLIPISDNDYIKLNHGDILCMDMYAIKLNKEEKE